MAGARHEDQPPGSLQRVVHPLRMGRRRLHVRVAVNKEHGGGDVSGSVLGADRVNLELRLLFGELKGLADRARPEEERCALGRDGAKIGEGFDRHNRGGAWVLRGCLQRDRRPERGAEQDDGRGVDRVHHAAEIPFLVEAVRARIPARLAVRPAVVRDDGESTRREALHQAGRARPVVRGPMEVDDCRPQRSGGAAPPAFQAHAVAGKTGVCAPGGSGGHDGPTAGMEQTAGAKLRQPAEDQDAGDRGDDQNDRPRQLLFHHTEAAIVDGWRRVVTSCSKRKMPAVTRRRPRAGSWRASGAAGRGGV